MPVGLTLFATENIVEVEKLLLITLLEFRLDADPASMPLFKVGTELVR